MLPKKWTGDLVGMMHVHQIKQTELAEKLGVTDRYVCMVLNGKREPKGAEERFVSACQELINDRSHTNAG